MPIDDLLELVETLQRRIDTHAAALQKSEALTRYTLIDPLLRGLGWDTADPAHVLVEYQSGGGSADYALLGPDGKPQIIIEAKRLGTPLQGAVTQGINYCIQLGISYFALTDGQRWELYETFRAVPLNEKLIVNLDMATAPPKTCLDALALWRPSVVEGNVQPGAAPVSAAPTPTYDSPSPLGSPVDEQWYSLSTFTPKPGTLLGAVRLPTGRAIETRWWGPFNEAIVRWLSAEGHLTAGLLPILNSNGKFVLALKSDPPMRSGGKPLKNLRPVEEYLLNTNFNGATNMSNARLIIERAGQNPADFAVQLR